MPSWSSCAGSARAAISGQPHCHAGASAKSRSAASTSSPPSPPCSDALPAPSAPFSFRQRILSGPSSSAAGARPAPSTAKAVACQAGGQPKRARHGEETGLQQQSPPFGQSRQHGSRTGCPARSYLRRAKRLKPSRHALRDAAPAWPQARVPPQRRPLRRAPWHPGRSSRPSRGAAPNNSRQPSDSPA